MTKRKLIPKVWYCKYCYKRRPIRLGDDGSIIVCSVCEYGLAPWDAVEQAGSMRSWWDGVVARYATEMKAKI